MRFIFKTSEYTFIKEVDNYTQADAIAKDYCILYKEDVHYYPEGNKDNLRIISPPKIK